MGKEILTPETELEQVMPAAPEATTPPGDVVKAKISFTSSSKKALDHITNQHENAGWDIERIVTDDKISKDGDIKVTYKATLGKEFLVDRDGNVEAYEDALNTGGVEEEEEE